MSEETKANGAGDDELSLVDLLAVCLRYRRLIVGLPLAVVLVLGLLLYGLPLVGIAVTKRDYTSQLIVKTTSLPAGLGSYMDFDPVRICDQTLGSIPNVLQAYETVFPERLEGMNAEEKAGYVKRQVMDKALKFSFEAATQRYIVTYKTIGGDKGGAERFLGLLWRNVSERIASQRQARIEDAIFLVKEGIKVYESGASLDPESLAGKVNLLTVGKKLEALSANVDYPFMEEPLVLVYSENGGSRGKTVILAAFASLFVAILGAFVLDAARRVRADDAAMAKLRTAIRGK